MEYFVKGIIFSYDRAMQLDAVLRSYFKHCCDNDIVKVTVLYKFSDERNHKQYLSLVADYPQVQFIQQGDFRKDVLSWASLPTSRLKVKLYQVFASIFTLSRGKKLFKMFFNKYIRRFLVSVLPFDGDQYLLFLVDDNIFTHHFSIQTAINHLKYQPKALGFSLRLGKNTNYCYSLSSSQCLPDFVSKGDHVLQFNWTNAEYDFNYPLEISSSVYRKNQILPLLLRTDFGNPNGLEGVIASQAYRYARTNPFLFCFETSITFCAPINIVQNVVNNRVGNQSLYSAASLCQIFESGERINIRVFDDFVSNSCHQEVELFFTKKVK